MGLYRKMTPAELAGECENDYPREEAVAMRLAEAVPRSANKRGRPIVSTGDPARDKRNVQQRELMRKRRAKK